MIVELGGTPAAIPALPPGVLPGQTSAFGGVSVPPPAASGALSLERRSALVTLGDKIARALGDEVDETPAPDSAPPARIRRSRKVEY